MVAKLSLDRPNHNGCRGRTSSEGSNLPPRHFAERRWSHSELFRVVEELEAHQAWKDDEEMGGVGEIQDTGRDQDEYGLEHKHSRQRCS